MAVINCAIFRAICLATTEAAIRCSYMKGRVTLGNVSCNLSRNVDRKELCHVVKFPSNTDKLHCARRLNLILLSATIAATCLTMILAVARYTLHCATVRATVCFVTPWPPLHTNNNVGLGNKTHCFPRCLVFVLFFNSFILLKC